jgi:hypothetical protein
VNTLSGALKRTIEKIVSTQDQQARITEQQTRLNQILLDRLSSLEDRIERLEALNPSGADTP